MRSLSMYLESTFYIRARVMTYLTRTNARGEADTDLDLERYQACSSDHLFDFVRLAMKPTKPKPASIKA
jgi:hypothetical protein